MGYFGWRPYVPVAERRRKAAKALEKLTREVNEAIMLGWEPIGGLTTVGGQRFFQAMIKRR